MRALARQDFTPDERAVPPAPAAAPPSENRYGEPGTGFAADRKLDWKAIVAILLLHALVIGGIMAQRQHMAKKRVAEAMLVVDLAPPAPPPPPKAAPEIAEIPPVVVPPPVITIENPPPSITAVVMENPPPPAPRAAAVADPAPAPVAAPAAPVSAPAPRIAESADLGSGLIAARPPRYPRESRRLHEQGVVTLLVLVGEDGKVAEISVRKSSGFRRLDEAALAAVREWRWRPTVVDGHPVMVRGFVPIPFELRAG